MTTLTLHLLDQTSVASSRLQCLLWRVNILYIYRAREREIPHICTHSNPLRTALVEIDHFLANLHAKFNLGISSSQKFAVIIGHQDVQHFMILHDCHCAPRPFRKQGRQKCIWRKHSHRPRLPFALVLVRILFFECDSTTTRLNSPARWCKGESGKNSLLKLKPLHLDIALSFSIHANVGKWTKIILILKRAPSDFQVW